VLEKMGARVFWDEPTRTMIAQRNRTEIRFPAIGYATINGDRVLLDTPAFLVDGASWCRCAFWPKTWARAWPGTGASAR
jgi:hypothetical protein